MNYNRPEITRAEAKQIAGSHFYDPFCISMSGIFRIIDDSAHNGFSDCKLTIPEENLHQFKKELREKGFSVYSVEIKPNDLPQNCNNIFERYPSYKEMYHLEIEWH